MTYWFDPAALDQVPPSFTKYEVARHAGIGAHAAHIRLRYAVAEGVVQKAYRREHGDTHYQWAESATLEGKARLLAVRAAQQIDRILADMPAEFSTRHLPARLFQHNAEKIDSFMKLAKRLGKIEKVCATSKRQTTWRRASRKEESMQDHANDNTRPLRLYVAGPMSGLPESNYPAFNAAASQLREMGYLVENPAENNLGDGATWHDFMRAGIAQLIKCDAIVMLPGWTDSRGAKTEFMLAVNLDMRAFELDKLLDRARPYTRREVAA